jgi:hypothetical protein
MHAVHYAALWRFHRCVCGSTWGGGSCSTVSISCLLQRLVLSGLKQLLARPAVTLARPRTARCCLTTSGSSFSGRACIVLRLLPSVSCATGSRGAGCCWELGAAAAAMGVAAGPFKPACSAGSASSSPARVLLLLLLLLLPELLHAAGAQVPPAAAAVGSQPNQVGGTPERQQQGGTAWAFYSAREQFS